MTMVLPKRDRLEIWRQICSCHGRHHANNTSNSSYFKCQCGAALEVHLVCQLCGCDLVPRRQAQDQRPFWGCPGYPHCTYTLSMADLDVQEQFHPPQAPTTAIQHLSPTATSTTMQSITPSPTRQQLSPQAQSNQGVRRQLFYPPINSTTTTRTITPQQQVTNLGDTFIGNLHAVELIAHHGIAPFVNANEGGHASLLSYYENPNHDNNNNNNTGVLYAYWYDDRHNHPSSNPTVHRPAVLGRKPTVLDLFAGAGGMSQGLAQAGFHIPVAVEWNKAAADTLRWNHRDTIVFQQTVQSFLKGMREKRPNYPATSGEFDHIHASPPCQGFSEAKPFPHANDHERNELTKVLFEAVRLIQPQTISMENVRGILSHKNRHYLQWVVAELLKMNYQVQVSLVNAKNYGVPQHRVRMILVAAKRGFPLPNSPATLPDHDASAQVDRALRDLEMIDPVQSEVPVKCRTGNIVYDHIEFKPHHHMVRNGAEYRLQRGQPARTVCRRNIIRHYQHERDLTIRERARLQPFPDAYYFCGNPCEQCDQIGNAVPVPLAFAIGRGIMASYHAYYS